MDKRTKEKYEELLKYKDILDNHKISIEIRGNHIWLYSIYPANFKFITGILKQLYFRWVPKYNKWLWKPVYLYNNYRNR